MQHTVINPWTWNESLGFVHANKVEDGQTMLFLAGQTASDEQGHTLCLDDMAGQVSRVLKNIDTILGQSGMGWDNVMRLNIYTTELPALMAVHDHMVAELRAYGCRHAGTLLGVSGLAAPGAMVEMEVTAVA